MTFMLACREAINCVEVNDDDKNEMLDEIILVIENLTKVKVIDSKKKTNLSIATYVSLARVNRMARLLEESVEFSRADGPRE